MDRATIRIPKRQLDEIEDLVEQGVYPNKSEAIRAAVRDMLDDHRPPDRRRRLRARTDGGRDEDQDESPAIVEPTWFRDYRNVRKEREGQ